MRTLAWFTIIRMVLKSLAISPAPWQLRRRTRGVGLEHRFTAPSDRLGTANHSRECAGFAAYSASAYRGVQEINPCLGAHVGERYGGAGAPVPW